MERKKIYTLTISCPDKKGIVASVASFITAHSGNIIQSDQHSNDYLGGTFFMRVVIDARECTLDEHVFAQAFQNIANQFSMQFTITSAAQTKRMAIMVSKYDHCLVDLLWRWESKELHVDIPCIITNHPDAKKLADRHNIPFYHFAINKDNQPQQEEKMLEVLEGRADFIVLARYMRILGRNFLEKYPNRIINIHHSFLPAFIGANPYERAFERGVKLIGATAHYATELLDEGPIIYQDVEKVSHQDMVEDLIRKGRDIERRVLAQAVRWHVEDKVLVDGNKTVVFE